MSAVYAHTSLGSIGFDVAVITSTTKLPISRSGRESGKIEEKWK